jgi:hypothetical protein
MNINLISIKLEYCNDESSHITLNNSFLEVIECYFLVRIIVFRCDLVHIDHIFVNNRLFIYEWLCHIDIISSIEISTSNESFLCKLYYVIVFIYSSCILEVLHKDWSYIIKSKKNYYVVHEELISFYVNS